MIWLEEDKRKEEQILEFYKNTDKHCDVEYDKEREVQRS